MTVLREPKHQIANLLVIFTAVALTGCDSKWVGPLKEPGPLPLSGTNASITRMVKTKATFEVTLKQVFWDEGNGPVPVEQRVKPVVDAIPKELLDQLDSTRNVPRKNGNGRFDQQIYDAWGVVVSVHPEVMIVTVRKRPQGSYDYLFEDWSIAPNAARGDHIHQRLEFFNYIVPDLRMPINAGTLVPWSDEMHVVSTDPKVKYGRLEFHNNQATVMLSEGKLNLQRHEDDVDVSRE